MLETLATLFGLGSLVFLAIVVPGMVMLRALRLSWSVSLAAGPLVTLTAVMVMSVAYHQLGVMWSGASVVGMLLVITCTGGLMCWRPFCRNKYVLRKGYFDDSDYQGEKSGEIADSEKVSVRRGCFCKNKKSCFFRRIVGRNFLVFAGMFLPAMYHAFLVARVMGRPDALLQNHDAMFHLNLIAQMASSGDASPFSASLPVSDAHFYPSLFHAIAAPLVAVVDVPTAFNATAMAVGVIIPSAGVVLAARVLGASSWAVILAPFIALSTMWTPDWTLWFFGQAPTALTVAMVPWTVALFCLEWWRLRIAKRLGTCVLAIIGLGVTHPGGAQWALILSCVLIFLWSGHTLVHGPHVWRRIGALAAMAGGCIPLLVMCWLPLLRFMATFNDESRDLQQVIIQAATLVPRDGSPRTYFPWMILACMGIIMMARSHRVVVLSAWGMTAALIVVTAYNHSFLAGLTGAMWGDRGRYMAILMMVITPAAVYAVSMVVTWCTRYHRPFAGLIAVVAVLSVGCYSMKTAVDNTSWIARGYVTSQLLHPAWLTDAEREAMEEDSSLFDGAMIYGAPQSGAGLVPVLTKGMTPHRMSAYDPNPEDLRLARHFHDILTDSSVCEIIRKKGGRVALFYDDETVDPQEIKGDYGGYLNVDTTQGFELLAQLDTAKVYRITACDGGVDM